MTPTLQERYGAPRPLRRRLLLGTAVLVAVLGLAWLAWAVWFQSTPDVQSGLSTYQVPSQHSAVAEVDVRTRSAAVRARCVVQALAQDHTVVGERSFEVAHQRGSARHRVQIRTERQPVVVNLVGCTTARQHRPR